MEAAKQTKGRKRPILVDTLGLLSGVLLTRPAISSRSVSSSPELSPAGASHSFCFGSYFLPSFTSMSSATI